MGFFPINLSVLQSLLEVIPYTDTHGMKKTKCNDKQHNANATHKQKRSHDTIVIIRDILTHLSTTS